MVDEFSMRQMIHEVITELDTINVEKIIEETLTRVPNELLLQALGQVLHYAVRDVLTQYRPRGAVAVPQQLSGRFKVQHPQLTSTRKGDEIRNAWQRTLDAPYAAEHETKRLGDCDYEDLYFIAYKLDKLAEDNQRRARGFREIAHLLTEHNAETVRKLPATVLMNALGQA